MYRKDYGEWEVPTSWEQVPLSRFTELMKKNGNATDIREIIAAITGRGKDEVGRLPAEFAESMMARLSFMREEPKFEPSASVGINGETYRINVLEELKFGEYVDVTSAMQADPFNYASFLAILCRKEGEEYDDGFVASKLEERAAMFASQPVTKVLPLAAFFLGLYGASRNFSLRSLTEGKRTTGQLLQQTLRSVRSGGCKGRSLIWRMRTWSKLKRYQRAISQL